MRTLVIGDIHGHRDAIDAALSTDCEQIVFVGDYLDSFTKTTEDQITCLRLVLDAIEADPKRVVGLLGNHEMSYLERGMRCSGWKPETQLHVEHLRDRMLRLLKPYVWVQEEQWLITHGGIGQDLLDHYRIDLTTYLNRGQFNEIGYARGGSAEAGGLYWWDFNWEGPPANGLLQVCGHSNAVRLKEHQGVAGPRLLKSADGTGQCWNVDNLGRFFAGLALEDTTAEVYILPSV